MDTRHQAEGKVIHLRDPEVRDAVFFRKEDLREGTHLVCTGRLDPGARWEVTRIWTFDRDRSRRVPFPRHLLDAVELRRIEGARRSNRRQVLEMTFQYLSYSAIWRLA